MHSFSIYIVQIETRFTKVIKGRGLCSWSALQSVIYSMKPTIETKDKLWQSGDEKKRKMCLIFSFTCIIFLVLQTICSPDSFYNIAIPKDLLSTAFLANSHYCVIYTYVIEQVCVVYSVCLRIVRQRSHSVTLYVTVFVAIFVVTEC